MMHSCKSHRNDIMTLHMWNVLCPKRAGTGNVEGCVTRTQLWTWLNARVPNLAGSENGEMNGIGIKKAIDREHE